MRPPLVLMLACTNLVCVAQHGTDSGTEGAKRHELTLLLARTHLAQGLNADGKLTWLALPSWGLNHTHVITPRRAIGLHTDIITGTFMVEEHLHGDEEKLTVERTMPIATAVMASWRPGKHLSMLLGGGQEFAKEGNLPLLRAGVEYTIHLGGAWETSGSFAHDHQFKVYDSYALGMVVARTFM